MATGPYFQQDGVASPQAPRTGRLSEAIVGQCHGKYYEATSRGNCYSAQTAATGVAPGTALGTTAAFYVYNPKGAAKRFAIQKLAMGYISGTLGAGVVHICSGLATQAVPTGTAITPLNCSSGSSSSSSATALTTATVTTTAGTQIDILCSMDQFAGGGALPPFMIEKDMDGEFVIDAGGSLGLHATAGAGTSPKVIFNAKWEEILVG